MAITLNFSGFLAAHLSPGNAGVFPVLAVGALIIILGLICDAWIINRFLPALEFKVSPKPWSMDELNVAVAVIVGIFSFSTLVYSLLARFNHKNVHSLTSLIIPVELVLRLAILGGFGVFFHVRKIQISTALGLDAAKPGWAIGWGTAFGLASLPPIGVMILFSNGICHLFHIDTSEQPIVTLILNTDSHALLFILVVFAVVIAPVFEEFLFRGFAYPALKQRFGMVPALLIVSAIFAIIHMHIPSLLPLFVLALVLGLAYEMTGSLLASITMHSIFNSIMIIQVFYQRGVSR